MKLINKMVRKLKYWYKSDSQSFIKYLQKKGVNISDNVFMYGTDQIYIDTQYPFLITIESGVIIAPDVRILTHDFSWGTLKRNFDYVCGASGKVTICENSFIGSGTIILRNSHIGKNCIIGAGSLVSGNIPDNSVAVGVPAKRIMSIDEYYKKRLDLQLEEALNLYKSYYKIYKKSPTRDVFREYFYLYANDVKNLTPKELRLLGGKNDKSFVFFVNHKPMFSNFNDFLNECKRINNDEK